MAEEDRSIARSRQPYSGGSMYVSAEVAEEMEKGAMQDTGG